MNLVLSRSILYKVASSLLSKNIEHYLVSYKISKICEKCWLRMPMAKDDKASSAKGKMSNMVGVIISYSTSVINFNCSSLISKSSFLILSSNFYLLSSKIGEYLNNFYLSCPVKRLNFWNWIFSCSSSLDPIGSKVRYLLLHFLTNGFTVSQTLVIF